MAKRPETALLKELVLFILDSYRFHLKLNVERFALIFNIHIVFVPKNITSILQTLDVVVNRSFRQFYDEQYDTYLDKALTDSTYQTKKGNVKIPSRVLVTE